MSQIHHTNSSAQSSFGSAIVLNPGQHPNSITWGGVKLVKHGQLDRGREVWHVPSRARGHSGAITIDGQPAQGRDLHTGRTSGSSSGTGRTTGGNSIRRPAGQQETPKLTGGGSKPKSSSSGGGSGALSYSILALRLMKKFGIKPSEIFKPRSTTTNSTTGTNPPPGEGPGTTSGGGNPPPGEGSSTAPSTNSTTTTNTATTGGSLASAGAGTTGSNAAGLSQASNVGTTGGVTTSGGTQWSGGAQLGIASAMVAFAQWSNARDAKKEALVQKRYLEAIRNGAERTQLAPGVEMFHLDGNAYVSGAVTRGNTQGDVAEFANRALYNNPFTSKVGGSAGLGGDIEGEGYGFNSDGTGIFEFQGIEDPAALKQYLDQQYVPVLNWSNQAPKFGSSDAEVEARNNWIAANPPPNALNVRRAYDPSGAEIQLGQGQSVPMGYELAPNNGYGSNQPFVPDYIKNQTWGKGVTDTSSLLSKEVYTQQNLAGHNLTPLQEWQQYNAYKGSNSNFTSGGVKPTAPTLASIPMTVPQQTRPTGLANVGGSSR